MSGEGILFRSLKADIFAPLPPRATGRPAIGIGSVEGHMLIMVRATDGTCLAAALDKDIWNALMIEASQIVEGVFGGTIMLPPPPPTKTLN